jgi:hypothetical protein
METKIIVPTPRIFHIYMPKYFFNIDVSATTETCHLVCRILTVCHHQQYRRLVTAVLVDRLQPEFQVVCINSKYYVINGQQRQRVFSKISYQLGLIKTFSHLLLKFYNSYTEHWYKYTVYFKIHILWDTILIAHTITLRQTLRVCLAFV